MLAAAVRALFVVDGTIADPAARTRVHRLLPALRGLGVEAEVLEPGPGRKWELLRRARGADVVVLQRVLPPRPLLRLLVRLNPALVFDFDDALFTLPELRPRFDAVCEAAVEVVAGSAELAGALDRRATVVPTVVEPGDYTLAEHGDRPLRVGWIGTAGNLPYLEVVRPALAGFELAVISSAAPAWPELRVHHVPWRLESAAAELAALDVGLAPLPDTPWTRGKCGLKALECMASGLPVVASPVGALATIVVPGETGFLARDPTEWRAALEGLANDAELRRRLGSAGRRRVEERYSVGVAAPALAAVLERAASARKRSA